MNARILRRCATSALTLAGILLLLVTAVSAAPPGTESRVSYSASPTCNNFLPSADNGWIVWQESCTGDLHIIAYNYLTGIQLTLPNATLTSSSPNIKGSRVVWQEIADPDSELTSLYYTDLTDSVPMAHQMILPTSYKTNPVVDGDLVVWEDKETSSSPTLPDILMYNITSSTLYNLTPGTPDSSQTYPSISGNRVVWLDDRNGQYDIFMNSTYSGWATVNVTPGIPGSGQHRPVINDNRIVWSDDTDTLYLNDMAATTIQPSYSAGDRINNVALCATYIAWKEQTGGSSGPWDIFVNNTASSSPLDQITDSGSKRFRGVVSDPVTSPVIITPDSRVIWVDRRDGRSNIYMFTYGASAECPEVLISASQTEGPAPLPVTFTDVSSPLFTTWRWEFGDGLTSASQNISHTYSSNGIYPARLLAGTPYCRNASGSRTISVGIPSVDFTGIPTEGIAPLTVIFSSTATGSPTAWLWDFGDGGSSALQNPSYVYSTGGTYTVNLTATNDYGDGVRSRQGYIAARNGMEAYAFTNITGISVTGSGSPQSLIVTKTEIPEYSLSGDKKILTVIPPAGYGWQNITFTSADAAGFTEGPNTITGRISSASLTIRDLQPVTFSSGTGSNLNMHYTMEIGQYSAPAYLSSRIWEGTMPFEDGNFSNIIHGSGFSAKNVSYTLNIRRNGLPVPSRLKLNLSAGSDWETGYSDIEEARKQTYVLGMGYNSSGDYVGMVLETRYAGNDTVNQIEYFEADVPPEVSFFSTFALAKLSGVGNPLQLITLTIASHVSPPSPDQNNPAPETDSDTSTAGGGAGKTASSPNIAAPAATAAPTQAPPDPGTSARIYTNANGVVTQVTRLKSTDARARITVNEGITAKDATGNPLAEMTIKALPSGSLPTVPSGSAFAFAGMAYEIGPDGATFSQPVSLTFTLPQAQWGQDYSVKSFDKKSGTWLDLPTTFDPSTGTVTVQFTHLCCFALFTQARVSPVTPPAATATPLPVPAAPQVKDQPPTSAVSTFTSMIGWVAELLMKNVLALIGFIALILAIYFEQQGHFPGSGR